MKLEDKLMNRIIEGKSDLEEVVSKNGTNLEIGGNLEVDGKLKVNSGFEVLETYEGEGYKINILTKNFASGDYIGLCYIDYYFGIYYLSGNTLFASCVGDDNSYQYINFTIENNNITHVEADAFLTLAVLDSVAIYRHDIVGKISDTESVSFTWLVSPKQSSYYNTPIDSLTDLVNLVLVGKYTASGTINGKQVIQVVKTSNTASSLKCLCVDGTEVTFNPTTVTDDVELLQ